MTKAAFIDSVNELYAMRSRVAKNARHIIEDMLRKKGNMNDEYLYGDSDGYVIYVGDNEHVVSIGLREDDMIIVETLDDNGQENFQYLDYMDPIDVIEIAYYLCRM